MANHFFIVGAQRCGTTYLYRLLDEHPEIEMAKPVKPEPKFFMRNELFEKGLEFYKKKYFSEDSGSRVCGEKSTSYIENEYALKRIKKSFPNAKIIVLLRNPVHRAISNYWFSRNNGIETLPLWEALSGSKKTGRYFDAEKYSVSPFNYLGRGLYADYIKKLRGVFDDVNIKISLYENLVSSVADIKSISRFLGVSDRYCFEPFGDKLNKSSKDSVTLACEQTSELQYFFDDSKNRLSQELDLDLSIWW